MDEEHFEYRQVNEEEEKLDFDNLVPCPNCKKPIPQDATMCLYCGKEVPNQRKPATWAVWLVIIAIIVLILFILF